MSKNLMSNGTKRSLLEAPANGPVKRRCDDASAYSRADLRVLDHAAEILGLGLEDLLQAVKTSPSSPPSPRAASPPPAPPAITALSRSNGPATSLSELYQATSQNQNHISSPPNRDSALNILTAGTNDISVANDAFESTELSPAWGSYLPGGSDIASFENLLDFAPSVHDTWPQQSDPAGASPLERNITMLPQTSCGLHTPALDSFALPSPSFYDFVSQAPELPVTEKFCLTAPAPFDFQQPINNLTGEGDLGAIPGASRELKPHYPSLEAASSLIQSQPLHIDLSEPTLQGQGECIPASNSNKRGRQAFKSQEERAETCHTRRIGACVGCKINRVRCIRAEDGGPCDRCRRLSEPNMTMGLPCIRDRIVQASLFDKGEHPQFIWSRRWKSMKIVDIQNWVSPEIKTIKLTQRFGNTSYELQVRQFVPEEGDSLERRWKSNGIQKSHFCAPYAIHKMEEAARTLKQFVDRNVIATVKHYINDNDGLLYPVYAMALKYSTQAESQEEKELLRDVLRLWTAVRMESRSETICGSETLGMQSQTHDKNYHNYGQYLVPPVLSAQIELIMTACVLLPLRKKVLDRLQQLILSNKTKYWFTIYLCTCILLHSCALLTSFQQTQALKYGLQTRYVYPKFVEQLHQGARTLLFYFHHTKTPIPFSIDWNKEANFDSAELNEEQVGFLKYTIGQVNTNGHIFSSIRSEGDVKHDYYFLSQLYDKEFMP